MSKLGIVTDEQFQTELVNSKTSLPKSAPFVHPQVEIINQDRGRGKGNVEVPEGLRKLIADEHLTNGRQAAIDLASDFDISPSSVSAYANGATSTATYNKPDQTLTNYLNARKSRLSKKALTKLGLALSGLTEDKLKDVKARDLAGIAKDMSTIAKNMEPPNANGSDGNAPKFVIYAPTVRDERSYETIVVNDNY